MDRTQLWGRRLLSGGFVALAVLGVRSVGTGSVEELVQGGLTVDDRQHCLVRDLGVTYAVDRGGPDGYGVSGAQVTGPPPCVGKALSVTFGGADGHTLARATGRFDPAAPTLPLDDGGLIAVDDVATIAVVLFD
jgi:hypothetical protein